MGDYELVLNKEEARVVVAAFLRGLKGSKPVLAGDEEHRKTAELKVLALATRVVEE